ncbi:MAG: 16S rRNA (cytosine(967)-C(5))-methyltransferase RsmB [Clostridia bacterium]|nr:16S rRNA (cytosine(967)-C(5))-methyltransferase RsmB [Clostridia bacterium]
MKARELALNVLNKYEKDNTYVNLELKKALEVLDNQEKALATELVYGVLRYKYNLDYIRNIFSNLKENKLTDSVKNILRLGIYQIMYLDKIPDSAACNESVKLSYKYANKGAVGFINAVLRNVTRKKDTIKYPDDKRECLMAKYSFPGEIADIFIKDFGFEKAEEIMALSNKNKGVSVRPNLLKVKKEDFLPILTECEADFVDDGNVFIIKNFAHCKIHGFDEGSFTIQDKASVETVELLDPKPNETVLDICAAPGGKSCYMAQLMNNKGKIFSCDLYPHRVNLIENTAKRLGVDIIEPIVNDGEKFNPDFEEKFDKILVDTPCSGLGVISKKPDIKWAKHDFDSLSVLQYNILKNCVRYLKKGGYLVYSTCTINSKENGCVTAKVLSENSDLNIEKEIQLLPSEFHDGFYMCKISKGK